MDTLGLAQVERHRTELEENISKLRKSLQHWQTWEIEYEGLREEIASLPDGSERNAILAIAREFRADLVDEKEIQTIIGREGESTRTHGQIVDLLARRVDYVSRNARTIEKQLSDAQKKRNALLLAAEPDYRDDAGLPLTDITEELDDEGNILSSKLETPASTAPQLVDVLKKAGVKDLVEQNGIITSKQPSSAVEGQSCESPKGEEGKMVGISSENEVDVVNESDARYQPLGERSEGEVLSARGLTEAEKIAERNFESSHSTSDIAGLAASGNASSEASAGAVSIALKRGINSAASGNEDDAVIATHPGDSPEEAALRREMLQYGLGEMGAIVAELDLEENGSEMSCTEDQAAFSFDGDFDEDDIDDEGGSEDENGMVKHPSMSRKYLERMKELEEKHGIKAMLNLGPDASKLPREVQSELDKLPAAEAARKATLAREAEIKVATTIALEPAPELTRQGSAKPRKRVAFAEDLDIAPETETQTGSSGPPRPRPEELVLVKPVKDSIVERQSSIISSSTTQVTNQSITRKPSKFRAAREATPQTPLLPPSLSSQLPQSPSKQQPRSPMPPHKILADSIVERDVSTKLNPPDSHDLDEEIHQKEIAEEYYKLRNRMIQRQGGFVGGGEADNYGEEITPLPVVDENGNERKISRFKAARLK